MTPDPESPEATEKAIEKRLMLLARLVTASGDGHYFLDQEDASDIREVLASLARERTAREQAEAIVGKLCELYGCCPEMVVLWAKHAEARADKAEAEARRLREESIKVAWRAAITLAANVCIGRSNRYNDEDGPFDKIYEASDCAKEIVRWTEPTKDTLRELSDILDAALAQPAGEAGKEQVST